MLGCGVTMSLTRSFQCRRRWPLAASLLMLALPAWAAAPAAKEPPRQTLRVEAPTAKPPALEPNRQVLQVEAPTDKPPPLERTLADIPGPACTPEHRAAIEEALAAARPRLAAALRLVREQPGDPHVRRWFGDASPKVIGMTLELTAARLADVSNLDIRCNDPASCPGGRFAYARERDLVLGVCPPFFRARMDGTDSRWGILIHEGTHVAANTRDHAYRPTGAMRLAKDDAMRAAENADNYEYFVETLPQ